MARYRYYDGYPRYVSEGEKQARNRKAAAKLRKRDSGIRPVVVEGRAIAKSWWEPSTPAASDATRQW